MKQWFPVLSSFNPPDNVICWQEKWSRQLRTPSIFTTEISVDRPTHPRSPGLASSDSKIRITDSGDWNRSLVATLLAKIPHNWSSTSWVWDLRRFRSPVTRMWYFATKFIKYRMVYWFLASLTVLSEPSSSVVGMAMFLAVAMRKTDSSVLDTSSIMLLLSWRVHSSITYRLRHHPQLIQCDVGSSRLKDNPQNHRNKHVPNDKGWSPIAHAPWMVNEGRMTFALGWITAVNGEIKTNQSERLRSKSAKEIQGALRIQREGLGALGFGIYLGPFRPPISSKYLMWHLCSVHWGTIGWNGRRTVNVGALCTAWRCPTWFPWKCPCCSVVCSSGSTVHTLWT